MTLVNRANDELIEVYGETITITPTSSSHSADDIWESTNEFDSSSSYDVKARVIRTAKALEQLQAGLSDEAESAVYFKNEEVSVGDKVEIGDTTWVVQDTETSRLGNGIYRQIAPLVSLDK